MSLIKEIFKKQRDFFLSGETHDIDFRRTQLNKLYRIIKDNEAKFLECLNTDLGKPEFEAIGGEFEPFYEELRLAKRKVKNWAKREFVPTKWWRLSHLLARSSVQPQPRGVVGIFSPWNYPLQLLLSPLVGSIAAGNCSILKPSELAPATSAALAKILSTEFSPSYIACIEGDKSLAQEILAEPLDLIFFTGSTQVGKKVMEAAAKNLTPVILELGGKSPCILDEMKSIKTSLKRILWGKFFNAGQVCVAPDYLLVPEDRLSECLSFSKEFLSKHYSLDSTDLPKIVNPQHLARLEKLLEGQNIVYGGQIDRLKNKLAPTLVLSPSWDSPIMNEEIFGPILPILTYSNFDELLFELQKLPKPLATYLYSENKNHIDAMIKRFLCGGLVINDCMIHVANHSLPFGGVGSSGMGSYHGEFGFRAFSHLKAIEEKSLRFDLQLRYPPYHTKLNSIHRRFL